MCLTQPGRGTRQQGRTGFADSAFDELGVLRLLWAAVRAFHAATATVSGPVMKAVPASVHSNTAGKKPPKAICANTSPWVWQTVAAPLTLPQPRARWAPIMGNSLIALSAPVSMLRSSGVARFMMSLHNN